MQTSLDVDTGLFGPRDKPKPTFTHTVVATPEVVAELKKQEGLTVRATEDGKVEIAVTGGEGRAIPFTLATENGSGDTILRIE